MKIKSHSGAKKRFKITANGKLKARKASKRHLLMQKSKRQKNTDAKGKVLNASDTARMKKILPYL